MAASTPSTRSSSDSCEIGEFRAGTIAALIGTVPAVVIGAIAVAGLWPYLFPALR